MRQASEIALKLASLSVYNSILQQSVPSALYELLWAACTNAKEFVMAWGNFVQVLAKESALDTSAQAMTQAILYHQNPQKTSKLLYYFLSLCKTFNELFYSSTPVPRGLTRPCFPKASAKVDTFTVIAKYYDHFFSSGNSCKFRKTSPNKQGICCKTYI